MWSTSWICLKLQVARRALDLSHLQVLSNPFWRLNTHVVVRMFCAFDLCTRVHDLSQQSKPISLLSAVFYWFRNSPLVARSNVCESCRISTINTDPSFNHSREVLRSFGDLRRSALHDDVVSASKLAGCSVVGRCWFIANPGQSRTLSGRLLSSVLTLASEALLEGGSVK